MQGIIVLEGGKQNSESRKGLTVSKYNCILWQFKLLFTTGGETSRHELKRTCGQQPLSLSLQI